MAVELGASRLLAPYFSSSQIVWTIIIGTIMIAMALGNIYGGKSADKDPDPSKLYRRIFIASLWIAAIPVAGKYIIIAISGVMVLAVNKGFLIIAAFISCMVIFVFPLFMLGTVTPSLVKACVEDLSESGSVVGRLGACNTIGSIIGTFLPTFVTIPAVGTSVTFLLFSGILLVISLLYFFSAHLSKKKIAAGVVIFLICSIFGHNDAFAFWEDDLSYEGESVYNYLQVKEDDTRVILSTNVLFGVQSVKMKQGDLTGMYYDHALAGCVMAGATDDNPPDVLVLGNGSGTFLGQCFKFFPGCSVTGVEIDGDITSLAYEYFDMPEDADVYEYDGRAFLQASDKKYDVILVDAYQDITIPFQMSSIEFFTLVKEHLTENGVMVVNMNMHSDGDDSINEYLTDTIASVFPYVSTSDVPGMSNRELFAAVNNDPGKSLKSNLSTIENASLYGMMRTVATNLVKREGGDLILTDDKAPVELLGMRMIDSMIENELGYYKSVYEQGGLSGVMESLGI